MQKCPNSFRGKCIQLLILLNLNDDNAKQDLFYLLEKSLYSFDNHIQEYYTLLSSEGKAYLKQILPLAIQKNRYFEVLPNLYKNSLLMNINDEKILSLSLKYTIPKHDSTYENRKSIYIDSILATIDQLRTLYVRARGYLILERALQVLPGEPIFLFEKAMIDFERRNYDIAQQLFEQIIQKQNNHIQAIVGNIICFLILKQYSEAETFLQRNKLYFTTYKEMYLLLEALTKKEYQEVVNIWTKIASDQKMKNLFEVWGNSIHFIVVTQK